MKKRVQMLLPAAVVFLAFTALAFSALHGDSRNSFGHAAALFASLRLPVIEPSSAASVILVVCLIPMAFLSYFPVALASLAENPREYQLAKAALHPIAVFLLLWELTFGYTGQVHLRAYRIFTRIFLLYAFGVLLMTMWLGLPYQK